MRVFNEDKTQEIEQDKIDYSKYQLENDVIIHHIKEQPFIARETHYEVIAEYPNGGKDVKEVVDVEGQEYIPEHDEEEKILKLVRLPEYVEPEPIPVDDLTWLRNEREGVCFTVINRGKLWYDNLTEQQLQELDEWYHAWLDITDTYQKELDKNGSVDKEQIIPEKPEWLN